MGVKEREQVEEVREGLRTVLLNLSDAADYLDGVRKAGRVDSVTAEVVAEIGHAKMAVRAGIMQLMYVVEFVGGVESAAAKRVRLQDAVSESASLLEAMGDAHPDYAAARATFTEAVRSYRELTAVIDV